MLRAILRFASSRSVAVLLLLVLALAAFAGGLVTQLSLAGARWARAAQFLINRLALNDLFQARWLMVLVGALMVNLVLCVLRRLRPRFYQPNQIRGLLHFRQIATTIPVEESYLLVADELRRRRFHLRRQAKVGSIRWSGRRNRSSLAGSLLFHLALLIAVAGFALRSRNGFEGELVLFPDQAGLVPPLQGESLQVQLLDFASEYNLGPGRDNYVLRQRRSNLVLYDNGRFQRPASLSINRPVYSHGIGLFQAEPVQTFVLRVTPPDTVLRVREGERFELAGQQYLVGLARLGAVYQGDSIVERLPVQAPLFRYVVPDSTFRREPAVDTLRLESVLPIGRHRVQLLNVRQGAKLAYRYDPALPWFYAAGALFLLGMVLRGLLPAYEIAGTISEEEGVTVLRIGGRALGLFTSLRPIVNRIVEQFSTADSEEHATVPPVRQRTSRLFGRDSR
jgi:cytochrome c biogenesis protein ResB